MRTLQIEESGMFTDGDLNYTTKNYHMFKVVENRCNNVVLPTLFIVVNNIVQHC